MLFLCSFKLENYHHLYGNNCYVVVIYRVKAENVCAALGNGKHGVPFELVVMSVQQKLQHENIRKIKYSHSLGIMKVFWL